MHFQMLKDKKRQDRLCKMGSFKIKKTRPGDLLLSYFWTGNDQSNS